MSGDSIRRMEERLRELERLASDGGGQAETREMKLIAIAAAADMREALGTYALRGELTAASEHYYRKVQAAVSEIIEHRKADDTLSEDDRRTMPTADWPGWEQFPYPKSEPELSRPAAKIMASVRVEVLGELAGVRFGDAKTVDKWKVALDGLCADARFSRDSWANRHKSADKAINAFDRIASILQSMMKSDATASRYDGSAMP